MGTLVFSVSCSWFWVIRGEREQRASKLKWVEKSKVGSELREEVFGAGSLWRDLWRKKCSVVDWRTGGIRHNCEIQLQRSHMSRNKVILWSCDVSNMQNGVGYWYSPGHFSVWAVMLSCWLSSPSFTRAMALWLFHSIWCDVRVFLWLPVFCSSHGLLQRFCVFPCHR